MKIDLKANARGLLMLFCLLIASGCNSGKKETVRTNDAKQELDSLQTEIQTDKKVIVSNALWRWRSEDKSREFTVKILKLTDDSLIAQYCAVYNNGGKLDCDFDGDANIRAAFDKDENAYTGNFKSFFNSGYGACSIKWTNDNLIWKIIKAPAGEYYAPDQCVLEKVQDSEKEKESQQKVAVKNSLDIFPLDYDNLSRKIEMTTSTDAYVKNIFKQQYQLGVDASAELPSNGDFHLYLISNVSGDSDLLYLITTRGQTFIDGLEIANSNGDEAEQTVFSMDTSYDISLFLYDGNQRKLEGSWQLNGNGKFIKIK
ncbi:hypothetical protein [Pararcticibacter amylolyticus]|uniref:Lipoprotein n=1 Tax=Pararcticibacter amylolyticus TaxID=2173175 RepID=A0A2U2PJ43_9SPHI|nr:hypothetical protein [Pararcticibacter amylolyticus]PWG81390.1 hypothetical protein DDR33_05990 [Pararcticibacter amylolyticus]